MAITDLRLVESRSSTREDTRLRVAIASRDGRSLDAHFGAAERLMVYEVTRRSSRCVQVIACGDEDSAAEDDKIGRRIEALAGCHVLFALAIGPPAAARIIRANIHPVKVEQPEPIAAVLTRARRLVEGDPPRWLRKILTKLEGTR